MTLAPGTQLGSYQIVGSLGKGGMGEVYRSRDEKLGREVALKLLPEALTGDADRLERFHREARSLAALNHPGIAAIYGLEEAEGAPFLVLELVEGEDLAARVARGALPVEEALSVAKQIAEALEQAHEKGLVHRDLKPANVKLTPDGKVKLLDFGLAKALAAEDAEGAVDASQSPTLTARATAAGVILGTAAYMAPEQAKGQPVDRRADVWAFGVVLYEMLTGARAFEGDGISDTLAAVLRSEVDLSRLPAGTPLRVRALLAACLRRDPRQRVRDIGDVRLALEGTFEAEAEAATAAAPTRRGLLAAGALLALAAGFLLAHAVGPRTEERSSDPLVFSEAPPPGTAFVLAPLPSPDGRHLALVVRDEAGETRLWVRTLSDPRGRPLPGTEGARFAFWAPDGQNLAFATPHELRRVGLQDESSRLVAAVDLSQEGRGLWTSQGDIIAATDTLGLVRIPAAGGTPQTILQREGTVYFSVAPLGESRFVYREFGEEGGIYAARLNGEGRTLLLAGWQMPSSESQVRFLAPDLLLHRGRGGRLLAQRIDAARPALVGEPVPVAEDVRLREGYEVGGNHVFSFLEGGQSTRLVWFDREGREIEAIGAPGAYEEVQLSPEGDTLLFVRNEPGTSNRDLWIQELTADVPVRFTVDPATDHLAVFSPDGGSVAWETHSGLTSLMRRPLDGSAPEVRVHEWGTAGGPEDWSPDGGFVLYRTNDSTSSRLWAVPVDGGEPILVVESAFAVGGGRISPDGRLLAYVSSETGRDEVYVQGLDGMRVVGRKRGVSSEGGREPSWRRDGEELFFLSRDELMAASVRRDGETAQPGTPRTLFQLPAGVQDIQRPYAAAPDGQRFVLVVPERGDVGRAATVIVSWQPEVR